MVGTYKIGDKVVSEKTFRERVYGTKPKESKVVSTKSSSSSSSQQDDSDREQRSQVYYGTSYDKLNSAQQQQVDRDANSTYDYVAGRNKAIASTSSSSEQKSTRVIFKDGEPIIKAINNQEVQLKNITEKQQQDRLSFRFFQNSGRTTKTTSHSNLCKFY